ncbi:mannosyltransferase putative-domain-containing protein [Polychytrium aggregatum]|uniref:mannosyltransferase putative-domain-containing protein n=1 Tax=Polychytrium aggregatum TaxID=110093 RepID=UPI0022FF1C3C|nr:mannosyltransferase putative-domain-containing protein [Polychytrium aggregatum]KAI9199749.1 mannosyltransferase putative-domain-containing protein [Polychytrium aggregatum]
MNLSADNLLHDELPASEIQTQSSLLVERWAALSPVELRENDYVELVRHMELYRDLYGFVTHHRSQADSHTKDALAEIESKLFPFITLSRTWTSTEKLFGSFKRNTRGIVLTTGAGHFEFAYLAIRSLRRSVNTTLPIEVFYTDSGTEKDAVYRAMLGEFEDLQIMNLDDYFDLDKAQISGFAFKPFTLLATSFSEAILIDADILFFQDPARAFDIADYKATGTYYFRDRTIFNPNNPTDRKLKELFPNPSQYLKTNSRILNRLSDHEVDSGIVIFNKGRAFHELLLICLLNTRKYRGPLWGTFWGDKELFWLAFEMLGTPYRFEKYGGGVAGYVRDDGAICGNLFHLDDRNQPLWMNGGPVNDRHDPVGKTRTLKITHWAADLVSSETKFHWSGSGEPFCLFQKNARSMRLSGEFRRATEINLHLWKRQQDDKLFA